MAAKGLQDQDYSAIAKALRNKKDLKELPASHPPKMMASEFPSFQVEETKASPLVSYQHDRIFMPEESEKSC